jgi:hypothetical protein
MIAPTAAIKCMSLTNAPPTVPAALVQLRWIDSTLDHPSPVHLTMSGHSHLVWLSITPWRAVVLRARARRFLAALDMEDQLSSPDGTANVRVGARLAIAAGLPVDIK